MSAGPPDGRTDSRSSILKKLSLGQLFLAPVHGPRLFRDQYSSASKVNSLQLKDTFTKTTNSQQEYSTNPVDGHVWKDEWRTRGCSRWPLTNSQFGMSYSGFKWYSWFWTFLFNLFEIHHYLNMFFASCCLFWLDFITPLFWWYFHFCRLEKNVQWQCAIVNKLTIFVF